MDSKVEAQLTDAIAQLGTSQPKTASLREARRAFERRYILAVLAQHQWRVGATANALGLQRPNLYRKARQLSIALKPTNDNSVAG
jgi:DNA-binding NtrC family response regulator